MFGCRISTAVKSSLALTALVLSARPLIVSSPFIKQGTSRNMSSSLKKSQHEAVWGLFIGDAVAMPVHWYYSPAAIKSDYGGWLTGYRAPNKKHPSSILTLSATGGSGRKGWSSAERKPIIGDVILHDKLQYWTKGSTHTHYHQGMSAGDNTLNALTALETYQILQKVDPEASGSNMEGVREAVMENYVKFMTTPGSHNDTYAESFHRSFFSEWVEDRPIKGKDIVQFSKNRFSRVTEEKEDHQLAVVGALVLVVPWVVHYASKPEDFVVRTAVEAVQLTHPAPSLEPYVELYAQLLYKVLHGADLKTEIMKAAASPTMGRPQKSAVIQRFSQAANGYDKDSEKRIVLYQEACGILGMACYIQGAMSTMMFLGHEYHDDFSGGVCGNANCGGENAHRGSALGVLLAAQAANSGAGVPAKWKQEMGVAKERVSAVANHYAKL